jgi:hypothetical protein
MVYVRQQPSPISFPVPREGLQGWLQSLGATLPIEVGRVNPGLGDSGVIGVLERHDGTALGVVLPEIAAAGPLEIGGGRPLPDLSPPFRIPGIPALLLAVCVVGLSAPALWRTVAEGRARPDRAAVVGALTLGAALVGYLALMLAQGVSGERSVTAVGMAAAMALTVVAGLMLSASAPSSKGGASRGEVRAGWLLSGAAVGLASLILVLPAATLQAVSCSAAPGYLAVSSALLAVAFGLFIEIGVRPTIEIALTPARLPVSLALVGAAGGLSLAPAMAGPWWWSLLWSIAATVGSGIVARHVGRWAAAMILAMYYAAAVTLPAFATSVAGVMAGLAGLAVVYIVVPALLVQRVESWWPTSAPQVPSYVREIRDAAQRGCVQELAGVLQSSLCVTTPALERGIEVGCVVKRAQPPASDVCRIIGITRDRLGVVLGDVPGEGVQGSIQASVVSTAVVGALGDVKNLAALPGEVERVLGSMWSGAGETVAVSVGILDRRSKSFAFLNAGHQPALLFRSLVGRFERVFPAGDPLRTVPQEAKRIHEVSTLQLVTKDLLIFHSDGLLRVPTQGGQHFGPDELERLVLGNPAASCDELAQSLDSQIDALLGGSSPDDDVVVLFLRGK